jgi:integrase
VIPIFPPLAGLLEEIRARRGKEPVDSPLMRVHECKRALRSACQAARVKPITHHDLRHLFATRCIESGVDIPTVSRWLGHSDGGALAMRTYGHLRHEHSTAQAAKVHY